MKPSTARRLGIDPDAIVKFEPFSRRTELINRMGKDKHTRISNRLVKFNYISRAIDFRRHLRIHRPEWFLTGVYVALLLMFLGLHLASNLFER